MFEDADTAGVVTLSATASFSGCSHLKARNQALRRAEQRAAGNGHILYLITCDTDGGDFLTSPEISVHDFVCLELHTTCGSCCAVGVSY